jgi:hypothetical protein
MGVLAEAPYFPAILTLSTLPPSDSLASGIRRKYVMSMHISSARAIKCELIRKYLSEHGPAPSTRIYKDIPEIGDSTETSRLIFNMRSAGEIETVEVDTSEIERSEWGLPKGHNNKVKLHRLARPYTPIPAEPEPSGQVAFEGNAQQSLPAQSGIVYWYSSHGELKICIDEVELAALTSQVVSGLVAFMRRLKMLS